LTSHFVTYRFRTSSSKHNRILSKRFRIYKASSTLVASYTAYIRIDVNMNATLNITLKRKATQAQLSTIAQPHKKTQEYVTDEDFRVPLQPTGAPNHTRPLTEQEWIRLHTWGWHTR
jgi:hypothetical protein